MEEKAKKSQPKASIKQRVFSGHSEALKSKTRIEDLLGRGPSKHRRLSTNDASALGKEWAQGKLNLTKTQPSRDSVQALIGIRSLVLLCLAMSKTPLEEDHSMYSPYSVRHSIKKLLGRSSYRIIWPKSKREKTTTTDNRHRFTGDLNRLVNRKGL